MKTFSGNMDRFFFLPFLSIVMLMMQHVARHAVQSPDPGPTFLAFQLYSTHVAGSRIENCNEERFIFVWGGRNYVDNWYTDIY